MLVINEAIINTTHLFTLSSVFGSIFNLVLLFSNANNIVIIIISTIVIALILIVVIKIIFP